MPSGKQVPSTRFNRFRLILTKTIQQGKRYFIEYANRFHVMRRWVLHSWKLRMSVLFDPNSTKGEKILTATDTFYLLITVAVFLVFIPFVLLAAICGNSLSLWWDALLLFLLPPAFVNLSVLLIIEMLFGPEDTEKKHWLTKITFGYWHLGILPDMKNKLAYDRIKQLESELIPMDILKDELNEVAQKSFYDQSVVKTFRQNLKLHQDCHEKEIAENLSKQFEYSVDTNQKSKLSADFFRELWQSMVIPNLKEWEKSPSSQIFASDTRYSDDSLSVENIKQGLNQQINEYVQTINPNGKGSQILKEMLASFVNNYFDYHITKQTKSGIAQKNVKCLLCEEKKRLIQQVTALVNQPECIAKMREIAEQAQNQWEQTTLSLLRGTLTNLSSLSPQARRNKAYDDIQKSMEWPLRQWIMEKGSLRILEKINFTKRFFGIIQRQTISDIRCYVDDQEKNLFVLSRILLCIFGTVVGAIQLLVFLLS